MKHAGATCGGTLVMNRLKNQCRDCRQHRKEALGNSEHGSSYACHIGTLHFQGQLGGASRISAKSGMHMTRDIRFFNLFLNYHRSQTDTEDDIVMLC